MPPTTSGWLASSESDRSAVDLALQLFRQHQEHSLTDLWKSIPLKPAQYELLLTQLKQDPVLLGYVDDKVRFDYNPKSMLLTVRTTAPVHEFFINSVVREINKQLAVISCCEDSSGEFAARVESGGSSRILLEEDTPDRDGPGPRVIGQRGPDAQFQYTGAEYPGVVLEISYAQKRQDLKKLAWEYIQRSNGDIKVVVGIDIDYGSNTEEATLSVWRARYTHEDGEESDLLDAEETIVSQPFRAADGSYENPTEVLCLSLEDFTTDEVSKEITFAHQKEVILSYKMLAEFLNNAEEMQAFREPMQGSQSRGLRSTKKTRKRKRSASPLERLRTS